MIVTAMLAWYDENPNMLYRAVTSASVIADHIIAQDGRWTYYPGTDEASPPTQYEAIHEAATDTGLTLHLNPREGIGTWTGQVAKRQHMLDQATQADWLLPLDADWELEGDREQARENLHTTQADALIVPFHTPPNPDVDLDQVASTTWHKNMAGHTVYEPLIWRNLKDMRLEDYHWLYSGLDHSGQRVALWGQQRYPQARTEPMIAPFRILHHCLHRDQRTIEANRIYCEQRDKYSATHGREP